jgi:Cd2+/Zn2+-exporting ATPase
VLIKGGVFLETMARARAIVFDKTGTLTTGRIRLIEVSPGEGQTEKDLLRLAGALEESSSHPFAAAIMARLTESGWNPHTVRDLRNIPGEGVLGVADGRDVWIGKPASAESRVSKGRLPRLRDEVDRAHASGAAASVLVADGVPGVLIFEDHLRDNAIDTIRDLRSGGVTHLYMLTGDHESVASRVAKILDIDGYKAELLPEEKLSATNEIRQEFSPIVMVGDGVNDAPALAAADVGIAIGSIGSDVALEAADIVLLHENIRSVAWVHALARRTSAVVRQNLALAIGVIVVLAAFTVAAGVPLPLAVIGHEGSTILVALNALRLLRT